MISCLRTLPAWDWRALGGWVWSGDSLLLVALLCFLPLPVPLPPCNIHIFQSDLISTFGFVIQWGAKRKRIWASNRGLFYILFAYLRSYMVISCEMKSEKGAKKKLSAYFLILDAYISNLITNTSAKLKYGKLLFFELKSRVTTSN